MRKLIIGSLFTLTLIVTNFHSNTLYSRPGFEESTLRGEAGHNFTVSYASDFPSEISSISKHQA